MFDRNDTPGDKEESLTSALTALYRQKQRKEAQAAGRTPFTAVVQHFERRSQRLNEEKQITAQLVSHLVGGLARLPPRPAPGALQVDMQAGRGTGFVRIENTSARPVTVAWVVGQPAALERPPTIGFKPESPTLAPGEACLVEISVELGGGPPTERLLVPIECRTGARRDRLQLVINTAENSS